MHNLGRGRDDTGQLFHLEGARLCAAKTGCTVTLPGKHGLRHAFSAWRARLRKQATPLGKDPDDIMELLAQKGLHERNIEAEFEGRVRYSGAGPAFDCGLILVAFTNRSGSNLLCDYLSQAPWVAATGEHLNHDVVARRRTRRSDETFPDYLAKLVTESAASANRHLLLKASCDQMAMLLRWNIPAMFKSTHVIHIRRRDELAQAVSLSVASQTQSWTSQQERQNEIVEWRPYEIAAILARHRLERQAISILTHVANLPLRVVPYEDMVAEPAVHLRAALRFCGLPPRDWTPREPKLKRQIEPEKTDFLNRARAEMLEAILGTPPE